MVNFHGLILKMLKGIRLKYGQVLLLKTDQRSGIVIKDGPESK